jgi:hypothetical protein
MLSIIDGGKNYRRSSTIRRNGFGQAASATITIDVKMNRYRRHPVKVYSSIQARCLETSVDRAITVLTTKGAFLCNQSGYRLARPATRKRLPDPVSSG